MTFSHRKKIVSTFLPLLILSTPFIPSILNSNEKIVTNEDKINQASKASDNIIKGTIHQKTTSKMIHSSLSEQYDTHEPISIYGDDEFRDLASLEGWLGDGTDSNPFIIEDYYITASSGDNLLYIQDSTCYFLITNCLLNGMNISNHGVYFINVWHGTIKNNAIYHNNLDGIWLESSNENYIINNTVNGNSWTGIKLGWSSNNNNIIDNTVYSNSEYGIWLGEGEDCNHNRIANNTVFNNNWGEIDLDNSHYNTLIKNKCFSSIGTAIDLQESHENEIIENNVYNSRQGFSLVKSNENIVSGNIVYDNVYDGFKLIENSDYNVLINNFVYSNGENGFWLDNSNENIVFSNSADKNSIQGIHLSSTSSYNIILNNNLSNNDLYGLSLGSYSTNFNKIIKNNFIDNIQGYAETSQAFDAGFSNEFVENFWSDFTSPDVDKDGIVDISYTIAGGSTNVDRFPRTSMNKVFEPIVIDGNESFTTIAAKCEWLGNGTSSNPYIIDDLNLTGVPLSVDLDLLTRLRMSLLEISNTDVHFQIRNCLFTGGTYGIYLSNVTNACIMDSSIKSNLLGIVLRFSTNCTFVNNNFSNNLRAGLAIFRSGLNTVINNSFQNDGIFLFGWELEQIIQLEVLGNTINGKELIFWQNVNDQTVPDGVGQIKLVNCTNILIENQDLSNTNTGLFAAFSSNLQVYNNNFSNGKDEGLWFWDIQNVTISNNTIVNCGYDGIAIYNSIKKTGFSISGNTISNTENCGIFLYNAPISTISENTVTNTSWIGIDLEQSENSIIEGNYVSNVGDAGIRLWGSSFCTVLKNMVNNTVWSGIQLDNSRVGILKGNNIINSSLGIEILSSTNCNLSENVIKHSREHGISLWDSGYTTLFNNFIFNARWSGIRFEYSDNCFIKGNSIFSSQEVGIAFQNSDYCILLENLISYSRWAGINLDYSENTYLISNFIQNGQNGINSWDSTSCTLSSNIIANMSGNGITIANSRTNHIDDNIILDCGGSGLDLSFSSNNWISNNILDGGLNIAGENVEDFLQAEVENNSVNGKLIVFWQNTVNRIVPTSAGQVILVNCELVSIYDLNFINVSMGILTAFCSSIIITNNTISSCEGGISILSSWYINISSNTISNIIWHAIEIRNGGYCHINGNIINTTTGRDWWRRNGYGNGIDLESCLNNTISKNVISNTTGNGIRLSSSENTLLYENSILECQNTGISLWDSSFSTLSENFITEGDMDGISIVSSSNCNIKSNMFSYNKGYGINLGSETHSINVTRNDFISNNPSGTSQANDNGHNNHFFRNFWNDWTGPDDNGDGIVDTPYRIDGEVNNMDHFPLTESINAPSKFFIPMNIITGVLFLLLIIGALAVLQLKSRK